MRKLGILCAALLCFVGTVHAQNSTTATVTDGADGGQMGGGTVTGLNYPWQVGANFSYQRFDIGNANTNLYGIQSSVTRYIGSSHFGIEGAATATFGTFAPRVQEQLVTYAGGLHVGKRSGRILPWAHVLAGGAHDRFSQGDGPASFNSFSVIAGGGVDILLRSHLALRVEGDFLGTHFGGVFQKSINAGAGLVINF
jgi:hypothetical protein